MTIYEIDSSIRNLVNEDGEIEDFETLDALQMEREAKIENIALWCIDLDRETDAIDVEIERLKARKDAAKRKRENLKRLLDYALGGEKYKSAKVTVSYRKSEAVEISPYCEAMCRVDGKYLRYRLPDIDKAAIKEALKRGERVAGAEIVTKQNMQIK